MPEFQCAAYNACKSYDAEPVLALKDYLAQDLPSGTKVFVKPRSTLYATRKIHVLHPDFTITADVRPEHPALKWMSIRHENPARARGVWSTFARNILAVAHMSGRNAVLGDADWENGGYAMARGRFMILDNEWLKLRRDLDTRLCAAAPFLHKDDAAQARALIQSDDPKSLWAIADLNVDCRAAFAAMAQAPLPQKFYNSFFNVDIEKPDMRARAHVVGTILKTSARPTLGWMLLTHTHYAADMRLDDPEHMTVLHARYAGLAPMVNRMAAQNRVLQTA